MGDSTGVLMEIEKISEMKPNILDAKGILIATFSSVSTPKELNDWFRLNKRNFLLFDLNTESSGFNITKKSIEEGLFGFLKTTNIEDKSAELIREIYMSSNTQTFDGSIKQSVVEKKITEEDIQKMTKLEKDNMMNKILENGVEKLTEYDKKILFFLAK